jgi:DNA-directed RNA polymerase subunit RPC12/RpoP
MDDDPAAPGLIVHRVTFGGLIPLARYYNCTRCDHDLTDWVMKRSPNEPSTCPNCEVRIGETDIARAQRDTKLGCLWTLVSIVGLVLASALVVGVVWLLTDPRLLNRFR